MIVVQISKIAKSKAKAMTANTLTVEVAYATPEQQYLFEVAVPQGCTATEAIRRSGLLEKVPSLQDATLKVGVFSQLIKNPQNHPIKEGDRLEVYRPLLIDPKQARRQRAQQSKR